MMKEIDANNFTPAPSEDEKRRAACDQVGQLHSVLIKSYNGSLI